MAFYLVPLCVKTLSVAKSENIDKAPLPISYSVLSALQSIYNLNFAFISIIVDPFRLKSLLA